MEKKNQNSKKDRTQKQQPLPNPHKQVDGPDEDVLNQEQQSDTMHRDESDRKKTAYKQGRKDDTIKDDEGLDDEQQVVPRQKNRKVN